ncbi:cell envelope integrity protein TolA [Corallococcus terminator]
MSGKNQTGRASAQYFWEELQKGAAHFEERGSSAVPQGRVRQFIHGLSLPFHIARALLRDPVARGQYLRVGLMQTVVALALCLTCMGSAEKAASAVEERRDEAVAAEVSTTLKKVATAVAAQNTRKAEREAARELRKQRRREAQAETSRAAERGDASARPEAVTAAEATEHADDTGAGSVALAPGSDEDAQARAAKVVTDEARPPDGDAADEAKPSELAAQGKNTVAAPSLEGNPTEEESPREPSEAASAEEDLEGRIALNLEQRVRDIEAAANNPDAGTSLSDAVMALVVEAVSSASSDESIVKPKKYRGTPEEQDPPGAEPQEPAHKPPSEDERLTGPTFKGFSLLGIPFWVKLFALMQIAQWVIIALSRDYHDVISREASLLTRVVPEDEAMTPYVRLNVQWMRKKVHRRIRAMILFAVGVPAAVFLVSPLFCLGLSSPVMATITSLWGGWWLMVFTAAKSAQAWEPMKGQQPPWFLRAWTWLTTRVPGLRWPVLQRYGAMWSRQSTEVFVPVAAVERHPWAYAGLSMVRFVGSFAPLKFFVRPLIPVASAHILREETERRARKKKGMDSEDSPRVPGKLEDSIRA